MKNILEHIACKACPEDAQINSQIYNGFHEMEIQLFPKHIKSKESTQIAIKACQKKDIDVHFVHAPLSAENRYQLIECIDINNSIYENTFLFVQELCNYFHHKICIVFHTEISYPTYFFNNYNVLKNTLFMLIQKYPDIIYSIENVIPNDDCYGGFVGGSFFENVILCQKLRQDIDSHYFFTTLDICHAVTTIRITNFLKKYGYLYKLDKINLENYFKKNAKYCNNIHFNGVEELGFKKKQHSILMDKNSPALNKCLNYINLYIKESTQLTLEILEDDYSKPQNSLIFRENIKNLANNNIYNKPEQ